MSAFSALSLFFLFFFGFVFDIVVLVLSLITQTFQNVPYEKFTCIGIIKVNEVYEVKTRLRYYGGEFYDHELISSSFMQIC